MKDEIKEILDNIKYLLDNKTKFILMTDKDIETLLDYITNLQEKYERMKENAEILANGYNELEKRIDKAIEYIKKEIADIEFMKKEYSDYDKIGEIEVKLKSIEELKNILNGDE
jgi:chromosome segregation ATPase